MGPLLLPLGPPALLAVHQAMEVAVKDPLGRPVPGALVEASRPGRAAEQWQPT